VAQLTHEPRGSVTLGYDSAVRRVSARISAAGFAPSGAYLIHLHPGTCLDRSQTVGVSFPEAVADSTGTVATSLIAVNSAAGIPRGVYLDVHAASGTDPIACTDVPASNPGAPLALFATPGHKPYGTASLTFAERSRAALLRLTATDLAAGTYSLAVRSGSCEAPGRVVATVEGVTTGPAGSAGMSRNVELPEVPPPSGWSAILLSGGAGSEPVLCGELQAGAAPG
jgi:hypothetical protein